MGSQRHPSGRLTETSSRLNVAEGLRRCSELGIPISEVHTSRHWFIGTREPDRGASFELAKTLHRHSLLDGSTYSRSLLSSTTAFFHFSPSLFWFHSKFVGLCGIFLLWHKPPCSRSAPPLTDFRFLMWRVFRTLRPYFSPGSGSRDRQSPSSLDCRSGPSPQAQDKPQICYRLINFSEPWFQKFVPRFKQLGLLENRPVISWSE
jgi:hypothetical protein